jgi:hypothetical protein
MCAVCISRVHVGRRSCLSERQQAADEYDSTPGLQQASAMPRDQQGTYSLYGQSARMTHGQYDPWPV